MIKWLISLPLIAVLISVFLNVMLALMLVWGYSSLTKEQVIASIEFTKIAAQNNAYIAHIMDESGELIGDYKIFGDQWRIDVGFIKMKYWANLLGVDAKYTLDRFEGRYKDIHAENNAKHIAYQLEDHHLIDLGHFFIDTTYGSSTYQNIKLNTRYRVLKSQTGLMVRENNLNSDKSLWEQTKSFF